MCDSRLDRKQTNRKTEKRKKTEAILLKKWGKLNIQDTSCTFFLQKINIFEGNLKNVFHQHWITNDSNESTIRYSKHEVFDLRNLCKQLKRELDVAQWRLQRGYNYDSFEYFDYFGHVSIKLWELFNWIFPQEWEFFE